MINEIKNKRENAEQVFISLCTFPFFNGIIVLKKGVLMTSIRVIAKVCLSGNLKIENYTNLFLNYTKFCRIGKLFTTEKGAFLWISLFYIRHTDQWEISHRQ